MCDVTISTIFTSLFTPVEALLLPHEGVGILRDLLANSGMLLQEFLQCWMGLGELVTLHQARVFSELFRDFGMAV